MDYNDLVIIANEKNWKITYLILGLSIGTIAFSIQDLSNEVQYERIWILFLAWGLLFISFSIGLIKLHHSLILSVKDETRYKNKEFVLDENKFRRTNIISVVLYWIMMSCFLCGIFSFGAFKIINLTQ